MYIGKMFSFAWRFDKVVSRYKFVCSINVMIYNIEKKIAMNKLFTLMYCIIKSISMFSFVHCLYFEYCCHVELDFTNWCQIASMSYENHTETT